jgi:leucyl aminopeptidase
MTECHILHAKSEHVYPIGFSDARDKRCDIIKRIRQTKHPGIDACWSTFSSKRKMRSKYEVKIGTEQNRTEQNRTEQNRTEQNRTEQNRTEQNRTEQNRTEQSRAEQSRTEAGSGTRNLRNPQRVAWPRIHLGTFLKGRSKSCVNSH